MRMRWAVEFQVEQRSSSFSDGKTRSLPAKLGQTRCPRGGKWQRRALKSNSPSGISEPPAKNVDVELNEKAKKTKNKRRTPPAGTGNLQLPNQT